MMVYVKKREQLVVVITDKGAEHEEELIKRHLIIVVHSIHKVGKGKEKNKKKRIYIYIFERGGRVTGKTDQPIHYSGDRAVLNQRNQIHN